MFNKTRSYPSQLDTLTQLNSALMKLTPSISGIDSSMLQVACSNLPMLDEAIRTNTTSLYDGLKRGDVLSSLKLTLSALVDTYQINLVFDTHGKKHFPGGDAEADSKFNTTSQQVNPIIERKIRSLIGRIRRDAKGRDQTYYYADRPIFGSNNINICIQVDYKATPESITYHGYPDRAVQNVPSLARTKHGPQIPA